VPPATRFARSGVAVIAACALWWSYPSLIRDRSGCAARRRAT